MVNKQILIATFVLSSHIFLGCQQESQKAITPSAQIVTSQTDINEPNVVKERFLEKIKQDTDTFNSKIQKEPTRMPPTPGYSFKAEYAGDYSYDIQKTESIVSPYIGTVSYNLNWYANGKLLPDSYIKADYVYQDGKWVIKDASRRVKDHENILKEEQRIIESAKYLFE